MNGWLSPKGEFFPCPTGHHHIKAAEIIKENPNAFEEIWLQISPFNVFTEHKKITKTQYEWLVNTGKSDYVFMANWYEVIE